MAVAMNTGGYFRSDFMISDAAIPMQLDELEAEQSAKFAELLGSFGTSDANVTDAEQAVLDEAVESELADMSEEALNEVLKAVAGDKAPTDKAVPVKKADNSEEAQAEKTDENIVPDNAMMMFGANMTIIESASDEFSEITSALAADETSAPMENTEPIQLSQTEQSVQQVQTEQPVQQMQQDVSQAADIAQDIPTINAQAQQAVPTDDTAQTKPTETAVNTQSAPEKTDTAGRTDIYVSSGKQSEQPRQQQSEQGESGSDFAQTLGGEKAQVLANAAEKGEISRPEVRTFTAEKQPVSEDKAELPAEEQPETPTMQTTLKSKISSASDELEMLKSARTVRQSEKTEQPDTNEAPVIRQAVPQDTSVRTEAGAPEVKREEIVRQAAELVRTAITENTSDPEKTEYSITLDPEELGKITVKLTKAADGAVSVTVAAERSATQRILEQNSAMLQDSLKNSDVRLESWQTVNASERENYAQDYNGSSKNPYYREEPQQEPDNDGDSTFAELIAAM